MLPQETSHLPPSFKRLAWSNLAAQSAEQVALAAASIVAVLLLGAGEGQSGLLQTALTLPFLLFAIPAGLMADRMSRRLLMTMSETMRAAALFSILILIWLHWLSMPLLATLGFLSVCGTVTYSVAAPALVPSLVNSDALAAANSRIELARTVAFASGPALGGLLVGWIGAAPAFGIAAGLSVIAVALLAGITEPSRSPVDRKRPLKDIKEGVEFVFKHALLRPIFVTQLFFNTALFIIFSVFVPYAVRHLHLSASGIGTTLAMYGAGMIVGALLAPMIFRRLRFGIVVALGPISGFVASMIMASTIPAPVSAFAALSFFFFGVGPILWVISTTTLRQTVTPPQLLGRVSAINILSSGTRPLGAAIGAIVGGTFGAEICLYLAMVGFAIQAVIILISPAVRLAQQPSMYEEVEVAAQQI
jgi:predicted MFS family arabinose efflux permease